MGYPYSWGEKGIEDHCDGGGAGAFGSHRRRPEYEAEIRVAGADRTAVGRGCWHDGDRASGRQIQARGVAVAGTVRRRRRGWLAARPATFGAASDGRAGLGWWSARNARCRLTPRTGARAAWPGRLAWARPPSRRSGASTA